MTDWRFFDACCTVGRHMKLGPDGLHSAADLLAEMDHHGIAEALVVHSLARETHPIEGNPRALEVAAASPRLHPAWVAVHTIAPDDQPPPDELLAEMRRDHVGALFLYPRQYRLDLSPWCVDPLIEPFAAARVPVFINYNEIGPMGIAMDETDWPAVVALCQRWPTLPVVVSENRMRRDHRTILQALDTCPNLRLEVSGLWLYRAIEFIVRRWGAERLLFGSNWPTYGQHMTVATVAMADIPDDAKRKIAGDNLRELMAWCKPQHPDVEPTKPIDAFAQVARTGDRPDSMRFLDCHGHLGGLKHQYHIDGRSLDDTVAEMDRLGVERCPVWHFVSVGDERVGNDLVIEAVERFPDRFIGFTFVNPHRSDDEILAELERCAARGLRGVKLATQYQGYPADGPHVDLAVKWAHDHRQIILSHQWGSAEHMAHLLASYPNALLVTGHSDGARFVDLMRRHPNLYVCSCPLHQPRACERIVERIGADRVMFGSDLQDLPVAWGLGPILFARIPEADKRLILGGNLQRLLQQYSLPVEATNG